MAEIDVLKAQIVRENVSVPWGFRLQGGTDYGQPLTILRITPGSPASRIGLKQGDEVTDIGDVVTRHLTHDRASQVISQFGTTIVLTIERRALGSVPTNPVMSHSPAGHPARGYDPYDMTGKPHQPHHVNPSYQEPREYQRASSRPFEAPSRPHPPPPQAHSEPEQPQYRQQAQPGPPSQQPQQFSTYTDEEEDTGLQQSRTFKILQSLMDNDGEPPPPVLFARKTPVTQAPSATILAQGPGGAPRVIANRQFNTPIGLYDHNLAVDTMSQKVDSLGQAEPKQEKVQSDPPKGPKPYIASETMRLVKQMDEEEKIHGRPNFSPPKSSRPPVGRVLDDPVPSKSSPSAYVPNYQMSKSLAHVMLESPQEQARRASTGTRPPPGEKERRLSEGKPPGVRKVEPPEPSPLARPARLASPGPRPYPGAPKIESQSIGTPSVEPSSGTPKAESHTWTPKVVSHLRTPSTESDTSKPESHTWTPKVGAYTGTANVESDAHKAESHAWTPKVEPNTWTPRGDTPAEIPKAESYSVTPKVESCTAVPNIESHSDSGYQTPIGLASPVNVTSSSLESTERGSSSPSYNYQPRSPPTTPETETHTFTSSMVVTTSRAQIKLPASKTSSSSYSSPHVSSSVSPNMGSSDGNKPSTALNDRCAPALAPYGSTPAPPPPPPPPTATASSSTSASSSPAPAGSYFIPATGNSDGAVPIASAAATSSIIEAALRPKIRPFKPQYGEANSSQKIQQQEQSSLAEVTVSPKYKPSEASMSTQQIVVDEPGFPKAIITVNMPAEAPSESSETSSRGASGRSSPWNQASHSPASSCSPRPESVHCETRASSQITMQAPSRTTITLPTRGSSSTDPPEPSISTDVVTLNEAPRATIKIPGGSAQQNTPGARITESSESHGSEGITKPSLTAPAKFESTLDSIRQSPRQSLLLSSTAKSSRSYSPTPASKGTPESTAPGATVTLNEAPKPTVKIPAKFQSTNSGSTGADMVKQSPRQSLLISSTAKGVSSPKSETTTTAVTLNEAPRKTINIPSKFQQKEDQEEKADIAAKSKGKFQKLTSMFQNIEAESQKQPPAVAPKRSVRIPASFKQTEGTNGRLEKPGPKQPIKLPGNPPSVTSSSEGSRHTTNGTSSYPLENGRAGVRPYNPLPHGESPPTGVPHSITDLPEAPSLPDLPPPEFPPPPPPSSSPPPPPPPPSDDPCADLPLPPPPPADCPEPTTPDLPPPPPLIAEAPAAKAETKATQLYEKYANVPEEDRGPVQSRTFNALSNMMEGEPEPAAGSSGLPPQRSAYQEQRRQQGGPQPAQRGAPMGGSPHGGPQGAPRVKVFMPQQYNTPLGMYSAQNVVETFQGQAEMQLDQLEQKQPDIISGAQRAVLEDEQRTRYGAVAQSSSDF